MENETKKLMTNANENRNKLVENVKKKIEELESIIVDINSEDNQVLSDCIKEAQEYDVNYLPDRNIIKDFTQLKFDLNTVQEKLQSLSLTEDTIFDEDKYLIAAERLLEKIDTVVEKKKQEFAKINKEKLEQGFNKKTEIDIGLSNASIELAHIKLDIEDLENQNTELKSGLIYKLNISLFNKKKNAKIGENDDKLSELYKKKRELETRISKLELEEQAEHFVPIQKGQEEGERIDQKEERESEEVK